MKVLSWLPVAALLLVIGDQFARRNESPEVRALRAGLQDLPLTPAETAQVIDASGSSTAS